MDSQLGLLGLAFGCSWQGNVLKPEILGFLLLSAVL